MQEAAVNDEVVMGECEILDLLNEFLGNGPGTRWVMWLAGEDV